MGISVFVVNVFFYIMTFELTLLHCQCYDVEYDRNEVMVDFIMLGIANFSENSKHKPDVTQKPYNDFLEGYTTYYQVLSNSETVNVFCCC